MGASLTHDVARKPVTARVAGFWLPGAMLLLSFGLSLWSWYIIDRHQQRDASARLDRQRDTVITAIENRMLAYQHVLQGAQGLFAASDKVTRGEWRAYVENLNIDDYYPGIQGIGYSEIIHPSRLVEHVQRVRDEGFADYAVRPEGERAEYTAIVYLEPLDWRNGRAFGYDMLSEPVRRAAMERARDTGLPSVSGKVKLIQETEENIQAGFLMYLPIYRNGAPTDNVAQRREALVGYVYSPFRMNDLMRGVLGQDALLVSLKIYSGDTATADKVMYDSKPSADRGSPPAFERVAQLTVGGHVWSVVITSTPTLIPGVYHQEALIVLIGGCMFSLLLCGITWSRGTARDRAQALAAKMTTDLRLAKESVEDTNLELVAMNEALRREHREREEAEQSLRETHQRFQGAFQHAAIGMALVRIGGRWQQVNPALCEILGYTEEELLATTFQAITHPDDLDTSLVLKAKALAGEIDHFHLEKRYLHKQGHAVPVLLSVSLVRESPQRPLYFVAQIQDVSDRKLAEERLQAHAKQLEIKNRELQDFVCVASHDLQEPLRKIQAFGDLVASSEGQHLTETGQDYIRRMRDAAGRMRNLIDDLLALSRVTSQTRPFVAVDLNRVAHEVLDDLKARIEQSGGRVQVDPLPTVSADPTQMRQLLQNLVGNAVKFQPQGVPPHIRIYAQRIATQLDSPRASDGAAAWQVCVEDNGIGFDIKYVGRIFAPFQRLHGRGIYEGTGMGLAICQRVVTRHGGEIWARSEPGKGSTFIFTLPGGQAGAQNKRTGRAAIQPEATTA
jgi:PAS domain S-box-containing protein